MVEFIFCKNCQFSLTGEPSSGDSAEYITCPNCGKKERNEDFQKKRNEDFQKKRNEDLQKKRNEDLQKKRNESIQKERSESIQKERNEDLQKKRNEDLQKKRNESIQKERNESIQKERNESIQKERNESIQKERNESIQKERTEDLQKKRNESIQIDTGKLILTGDSAQLSITPYPEILLTTAKNLIDGGAFSASVVVAHMACEISTEKALSRAFQAKGIEDLEEAVLGFFSGFNLANHRILKLYIAMTGDQIKEQPFWRPFKISSERRNKAVHKGKIVTKEEAEESYKATSDLVTYLKESDTGKGKP